MAGLKKGYVQVYTGDGKGKTTAAIGLAVRAAGYGLKVFIVQFLKKGATSEFCVLERFRDSIEIKQYGTGEFIRGKPSQDDIRIAEEGIKVAKEAITSGKYDLVILDEANVAVSLGLLNVQELIDVISVKPSHVELVITGRNANEQIIATADLVTEMKSIKHYYDNGISSRKGIEF